MDKDKNPVDRRRQPRVKPSGIIQVRLHHGDQVREGHLVDINQTGVYVATDLILERGVELELQVGIPGETDPRPVRARVARFKGEILDHRDPVPVGLGLEFLADNEDEARLIRETVNTTLALDLLGYGNRKHAEPKPTDTNVYEHAYTPVEPKG